MVKTAKLPDRPKPPNKQQIAEDFEAVTDDDVIFKDLQAGDDMKLTLAAGGEEPASTLSHGDAEDSDNVPTSSVEVTYKNITRLIKVHEELEKQPHLLQEKYDQLQKQSADIADSISELRSAAESVAEKS